MPPTAGPDVLARLHEDLSAAPNAYIVSRDADHHGSSSTTGEGEVSSTGLAWGWVAGTLALVAVGIIIAAAFSASARRQLVTLGQLSAQGATPRLTRRTLALQGTWTGLVGSAVGTAGGIGLLVALRRPLGRLGGRLRGSWRLAARSVGRVRTRSAGVVTAIGVAGAFAVVGATFASTGAARSNPDADEQRLPADAVVVTTDVLTSVDGAGLDHQPAPATPLNPGLRRDLLRILPDATVTDRRMATFDVAPGADVTPGRPVIADPAMLDVLGVSERDRRALDTTGLLDQRSAAPEGADPVFDPGAPDPGQIGDVRLPVAGRPVVARVVGARDPSRDPFASPLLITPDATRELGLTIVTNGAVIRTPADLTTGQRDALQSVNGDLNGQDEIFLEPVEAANAPAPQSTSFTFLSWRRIDSPLLSPALLQAVIVGPALLLTLLVVAIALSLSATESRDERDVLVAVGAPPRTLRRMAGVKGVVLTVAAMVLAVPTGLVPAAVVLWLSAPSPADEAVAVRVPWVAIALLLVAVPVVAGLAAWATSSLAQQVRPVRASTLAVD